MDNNCSGDGAYWRLVQSAICKGKRANQAWFEYLPGRVSRPNSTSLETFDAPAVKDAPIERFDAGGHSSLIIQAGTATSTRGRGEANSFNVIHIDGPRIRIERLTYLGSA